jgi:predicted nucleotidyltransferase
LRFRVRRARMGIISQARVLGKAGMKTEDLSHLSDAERGALTAYRDALLRHLPGQIRRLILYGSRARGGAQPDADLDVAVIVVGHDRRTPDGWRPAPLSDPLWQEIVNTACDVSLSCGIYLSPVVLTEDRLNEESPLIRSIRSEGIEVWSQN